MNKYRLSNRIRILSPEDLSAATAPSELLQNHYILHDQKKDREYLIIDTVKYYLDKFSAPRTQREVLKEIAKETNSNVQALKRPCSNFFNFLRKRKILVPEDYAEQIKPKQTLYKTGDSIGDLFIQEVISNKEDVDIYLATVKSPEIPVVIKLLNADKIANPKKYQEELINLEYEFNMLQKVKHIPSICQTYGFNRNDNGSAYILLEYIKGKSLSRFLKQTENLTEQDCYTIIENILQAFSLFHRAELIHGDIHPSNIMVNEDRSIKIIDLGFSFPAEIEKNEILRFGGVLFYMPPERINISSVNKFSNEPDFYSDVYQIGLIIYFIFYRKEPFDGFIWEELSRHIKETDVNYPALSFLNFPVLEWAVEIMEKCLCKKPEQRYATATAIFDDYKQQVPRTEMLLS